MPVAVKPLTGSISKRQRACGNRQRHRQRGQEEPRPSPDVGPVDPERLSVIFGGLVVSDVTSLDWNVVDTILS